MQIKKVLFCLTLVALVAANCVAQDDDKKQNKKKKAVERAVANMTKQMMKSFAAVNLTDEQKEKAAAIVEKHAEAVMEARKAQDGLLTDEQKEKRSAAVAKAREDGVKGNKAYEAGFKAMGLSEDEMKTFKEARSKVNELNSKIKDGIKGLLTEEQLAAMPKKGKGKGKKKDGKVQTVSLKLPGMTWGGCAASVRGALSKVDGIESIETDPKNRFASFKAPADLDVKATLDEIVDGGNKHIEGWSLDEGDDDDDHGEDGTTQSVSLKLPGMTWGGCARSVRAALTKVDGIKDIETDPSKRFASFKAPKGMDVKAELDKIADGGNNHIKGWSLDEE